MAKKAFNWLMIITLVIGIVLVVLLGVVAWYVLKVKVEETGNKYSPCVLYEEHSPDKVSSDRGQKAELIYQLQNPNFKILQKQKLNYNDFTTDDFNLIRACESNMVYKASQAAINTFQDLSTPIVFNSIADLEGKLKNNYVLDFTSLVNSTTGDKVSFANNILDFFNKLNNLYGNKMLKSILYNLEEGSMVNNQVVAVTRFGGWNSYGVYQCMVLGPQAADVNLVRQQYDIGYWPTKIDINILVHEMGHAVSNYLWTYASDRQYFNKNLDGISTCQSLKYNNPTRVRFYNKSPNDYLVHYLGQRAGIGNGYPLQQKLAAWSFVQSGYGREGSDIGGNGELFAEAFAQWLLTPDSQKGLNWQVLNDFYTNALKKEYAL
ncbi:hypothetical protein P344_00950 [Spiroplasma mirum ATCC 29335]|uniref:Uncharacterized protein n=1 Tax=Spiroplasma mirum ATCC 29335 TaxID=838561 RepID=W0GPS3_9MOLU|nr:MULTISPECIES: hypothetical protein [Spiroplasma]AHF60614.1 putative transmembrane protein [Spiroplasma mirum ATCC 29335]AHI57563.1 hypothetical protein P344_00950 [Spiroplasma mirum ATCC 29335]AKM52729.1 hypothetical protein SATRI_v1c01630 [Spiroplasma atrichopogonis]